MEDPTYPLFPTLTFLGLFFVLLPLPWHLKAWNSGTCFYIMWASLACLNQFINSLAWHNNIASLPTWCEISIQIMIGSSVGLPAASLCINRRLYHIVTKPAPTSQKTNIRAILVDVLVCVLIPLACIALQYVVQGHRFNIYGGIGCSPALYNTLPIYSLSSIWSLSISLISGIYCILALRLFILRRIEFATILSLHPSVTLWRYFQLMGLATTEILYRIPLSVVSICLNAAAVPVKPRISWEDAHRDYSLIEQVPAAIWRRTHLLAAVLELSRWAVPVCALTFFAFFGFAEEARTHYTAWCNRVCGVLPKRLRFRPRCPPVLRPLRLGSKGYIPSSLPTTSKHKGLHINVSVESISSKDTGTPISVDLSHTFASCSPRLPISTRDTLTQHHEPSPYTALQPTISRPVLVAARLGFEPARGDIDYHYQLGNTSI